MSRAIATKTTTTTTTTVLQKNHHNYHLFTVPFLVAVLFRCVNAFCLLSTFHAADEHYQGPEVAHEFVFSYGLKTWEWHDNVRLRSFAHPLLAYVWPYAAAKWMEDALLWRHDDDDGRLEMVMSSLVRAIPKVVNAIQCACIDVGTYRLARKWYNNDNDVARKAFALSLLSHWHFYCGCRSFANAAETAVVAWALVFWPSGYFDMKRGKSKSSGNNSNNTNNNNNNNNNNRGGGGFRKKSTRGLVLAFISCTIRPTAYAFWLCVGAHTILFERKALSVKQRARFTLDAVWVGCVVLFIEARVNCYYYNTSKWTFPAWNFFEFNILRDGASQYGVHSKLWVLTQGLPVVLGVLFPVSLYELFIVSSDGDDSPPPPRKIKDNDGTNAKRKRVPTTPAVAKVAFLATVFIVSIPKHKEFRFLHPLVPVAIAVSAKWWARCEKKMKAAGSKKGRHNTTFLAAARWLLRVGLLAQIPLALYLSLIHQRGMETIVNKYVSKLTMKDHVFDGGIHFWTPCHEHPFYASVHKNLTMRYLACDDPPSVVSSSSSFTSSPFSVGRWRTFEKDPLAFVESTYGKTPGDDSKALPPSHVVVFARERDILRVWFRAFAFAQLADEFHAHVPVDREGQERAYFFAREKKKRGTTTPTGGGVGVLR